MTADLLTRLGACSLAASGAVLLVLALRRPLRRLLGARLAYWLWLLVPVAMLASVAPVPPAVSQALSHLVQPRAAAPIAQGIGAVGGAGGQQTMVIFQPAAPVWEGFDISLLLYVWLIGAAGFAAYLFLGQRRAIERLGLLGRDARGVTRAASREAGPALIGLIRPRIVLPTDFESRFRAREQQLILAHERTHLEHGHLWINGLTALIRTVNWFNPLVHLGAFQALVDQELACDAAVVARFPGERRTYAEALLKSQQSRIPLPLGCHWPGRSTQMLQERLTMLAHHQPSRARLLAGSVLVGALCLGVGAVAWAASPARTTATVAAPPVPGAVRSQPAPYGATGNAPAAPARAQSRAASPAIANAAASADPAPTTIGVACFSSSCSSPAAAAGPRNATAVAAGIKAGDAKAVVMAGGSADDVLAAWKSADLLAGRPDSPDLPGDRIVAGTAQFAATPSGDVQAVRAQVEGGGTMIMVRSNDAGAGNVSELAMNARADAAASGAQVRQNVLVVHGDAGNGGAPTISLAPGGAAAFTITGSSADFRQ